MVPWLAAGISPGNAWARAPSTTSTIRELVSTLPAATAPGRRALTRLPAGADSAIGRNRPAQDGASSGSRQRKQ